MSGKGKEFLAKLRKIKREQWLIYLLGAALLAVILIPAPGGESGKETKSASQTV